MKSYRIALAQINPSVGDLENNTKKIINLINKFKEKADLLVFPELCIVGYPPEDLILRKALLEKVLIYINKIQGGKDEVKSFQPISINLLTSVHPSLKWSFTPIKNKVMIKKLI